MQYIISDDEFQEALNAQYIKGKMEGRTDIIAVFKKYKLGQGNMVDVAKGTEPWVLEFIEDLKHLFPNQGE